MVFLVVDDTRLALKMPVSVRVGQTDQCRYRRKRGTSIPHLVKVVLQTGACTR
jgi:hypothetical protein